MSKTTLSSNQRLEKILFDVEEWADSVGHPERTYFAKRSTTVDDYVHGRDKLLYAPIDLYTLGMAETGQSLLAAKAGDTAKANQHMTFAAIRKIYSEGIYVLALKGTTRKIISDLDGLIQEMFGAMAMGQFDLTKKFHRIVFDALNGGYAIRDGKDFSGPSTLRYAAMGLSIIHDWLGLPLDLDGLGLPRDPAWGSLVRHWRDPDVNVVLPILQEACSIHVERIALSEKEEQTGKFEFSSVFLAVHPTEILAVLRLREALGLENPPIDHPLMQTPYAAITCAPGVVTTRDPLMDEFLAIAHDKDAVIMSDWNR